MSAVFHIPHIIDIGVLYAVSAIQKIGINRSVPVFKPQGNAVFGQVMLNSAVVVL